MTKEISGIFLSLFVKRKNVHEKTYEVNKNDSPVDVLYQ